MNELNDHIIVLKESRYVLVVHHSLQARDQNPKGKVGLTVVIYIYMVNIECLANSNDASVGCPRKKWRDAAISY